MCWMRKIIKMYKKFKRILQNNVIDNEHKCARMIIGGSVEEIRWAIFTQYGGNYIIICLLGMGGVNSFYGNVKSTAQNLNLPTEKLGWQRVNSKKFGLIRRRNDRMNFVPETKNRYFSGVKIQTSDAK